ncbi:uncharacterized protein LOC128788638 [Vidua chalybeata]|uniref:uncharacterized protein LOC128788638 n=1 Tax=Vidua chalybeata TaxID=81927 RepID=UPI0023A7B143|nr:uncharacterized protein LOC128788638 [Vidua chalybeata]
MLHKMFASLKSYFAKCWTKADTSTAGCSVCNLYMCVKQLMLPPSCDEWGGKFGWIGLERFLWTVTASRLQAEGCRVAIRGILAFFRGARTSPQSPEVWSRPCYEEGCSELYQLHRPYCVIQTREAQDWKSLKSPKHKKLQTGFWEGIHSQNSDCGEMAPSQIHLVNSQCSDYSFEYSSQLLQQKPGHYSSSSINKITIYINYF